MLGLLEFKSDGIFILKKWLAISLKGVVSGGLIWYLLSGIDLEEVGLHLAAVDLRLVALSLVIFLLQIVIGGVRWASVLAGLGTKIRQGLFIRLYYVGAFFNQALPGSVFRTISKAVDAFC